MNEKINDIMKINKTLKDVGLLIQSFSETIRTETKEQKGGVFGMLLGTLDASLFIL